MCLNKTFSWSINVLKSIFFPKKTLYPKRMIQCQAMMMMIMTISLHHRLSFFTSYFLGVALTLSLVWLVRIIQNQWKLIEWCQWKTLWKIIFHEKKKTTLSILKTFQQAKLRLGCQFKGSNATEKIILPVSLRSWM